MQSKKLDKIKGCLVGLAIGDALGVHLEFTNPKDVVPINDYTEGNPYGIPKGYWTDDTSMALCMAQSLSEKKNFDAEDIMKKFCDWQRKGYMSSTGSCFDIGNTTRNALMEYWREPLKGPYRGSDDVMSAGNGSIMRLGPIPMFFHDDINKAILYAKESSKITHGYVECLECCAITSELIFRLINDQPIIRETLIQGDEREMLDLHLIVLPEIGENCSKNVLKIINGSFNKKDTLIKGTGYVVDSLEASLWALYNSNSFEEAVLKAVNLGDDADTTGAVTGQFAGAYFGYDAIPKHLKEGLHQHDMIVEMAEKLYNKDTHTN